MLPHAAKLSYIIEEEIKMFYDTQKQFVTTKPALKKIFKEILHTKRKVSATMKMWRKNNPHQMKR
jgi:hypothetical protein